IRQRNINIPGGRVELPDQSVVVRPTGEYASAAEIGDTGRGQSKEGYPLYLRDLVEVTRGYEDPSDVLNFRTVKVALGHTSGEDQGAAENESHAPPDLPERHE